MSDATPPATADNKLRAALFITCTVGLASSTDALVKLLASGYPITQLNSIRTLVSLPLTFALVMQARAVGQLWHERLGYLMLRGFILAMGNLCFFLAIAAMPMADAVAIYFTMPFFVAGLMAPLLGERVRVHRWLAIAGGFTGVIIMTRPGAGSFEPAALLALGSALFYGVGQAMARPLGHSVPPSVTAFWQCVMYVAVALTLAALFGHGAFEGHGHKSLTFLTRGWIWPSAFDFSIMVLLGIVGAALMPLFVMSYRGADASFVAPFEYTAMFWAVLWGVIGFGDVPDLQMAMGAAVVVAAGLFMLKMDARYRA